MPPSQAAGRPSEVGSAGSRLARWSPQCAVVTDVCFTTSKAHRCINTNPGFHCLPCPPRYKGSQPFGVGLEAARTEKQVSCLAFPAPVRDSRTVRRELGLEGGRDRSGDGGLGERRSHSAGQRDPTCRDHRAESSRTASQRARVGTRGLPVTPGATGGLT